MIRPTVVFVRVNGKPEYDAGAERWLASYRDYKPAAPHDVAIIDRYAYNGDGLFDGVTGSHYVYAGGGWDCGAWRYAARNIRAELLVCFNSSTRIRAAGWLERFIAAAEHHGAGLYGPLASYEIAPHLRTPCLAFTPAVIAAYPQEVNTREDTYRFESMGYPDGTPNITQWARKQGHATRYVARSGVYDLPEWRAPAGGFRNGDQSDLLVWDRHCEAYAASDAAGKLLLEKLVSGQ